MLLLIKIISIVVLAVCSILSIFIEKIERCCPKIRKILLCLIIISTFSTISLEVYDRWIASTRESIIADLRENTFMVRNIRLEVIIASLNADVDNREQEQESMGLQNCIAFFTKENKRIRFCTDYKFSSFEFLTGESLLRFNYNPEKSTEIIGKHIRFLKNFKVFVADYSEILEKIRFKIEGETFRFILNVYVNGFLLKEIIDEHAQVHDILNGQIELDISHFFENIENEYSVMLEEVRMSDE